MLKSDKKNNRTEKTIQIFIPEVIPLENKGEEAILRGYEDMLFPDQKVHFHILAYNCSRPKTMGNLTIYPDRWFYPRWVFRELYISLHPLDILNMLGFLFQGIRNRVPFLAGRAHSAIWFNEQLLKHPGILARIWKKRAESMRYLSKVDFVLAGHDNAMGVREAHLLQSLSRIGLPFGIFGCGMNTRWPNKTVGELYRSTFKNSKFLYFRDHETWQGIREKQGIDEAYLAPDPAFGMHAESESVVDAFIEKEGLTGFFSKPVVVITVVENAVIMKSFKEHKNTNRKAEAHYRLIGPFIDHIVKNWHANVLFLPHCIGPTTRLDDRRVARMVLSHSTVGPDSARILETPCSPRILKGLIRKASLLIGERTHSLIGAVSVGTPFICLGSSSDKRTREIIGNMCHASDLVYDLNYPNLDSLINFAKMVWEKREECKRRIEEVGNTIRADLEKAAAIARTRISDHLH